MSVRCFGPEGGLARFIERRPAFDPIAGTHRGSGRDVHGIPAAPPSRNIHRSTPSALPSVEPEQRESSFSSQRRVSVRSADSVGRYSRPGRSLKLRRPAGTIWIANGADRMPVARSCSLRSRAKISPALERRREPAGTSIKHGVGGGAMARCSWRRPSFVRDSPLGRGKEIRERRERPRDASQGYVFESACHRDGVLVSSVTQHVIVCARI